MGGSSHRSAPVPVQPAADIDEEGEEAKERMRKRRRRAQGRASTIITGGTGDVSSPNLGAATLGGS